MTQEVSLATWNELYGLADRIRGLAPWTWMEESDIFGVAIPDGETVFVSVMGTLGEHLAIAVYPNATALDMLITFLEETRDPWRLLEIPHVQLAFENRQYTTDADREIIARLGRKYRGKQAWPVFRSYRPGYHPWLLEQPEAETLLVALPQLLDVAPRVKANPELTRRLEPDVFLTRTPAAPADGWKDEFRRVPPQPSTFLRPELDEQTASKYRTLPQGGTSFELDFFPLGIHVGKSGERPSLPYCLLIVEDGAGLVISHELIALRTTVQDMLAEVPMRTLNVLSRYGARPAALTVRHGRLAPLMRHFCETLGIQLRTRRELPHLDPAQASLREFLSR